ncbi:hypothetical protein TL16_g01301 [Triparma laevis f. inornata]|uniref:Heterokaryon incompatibility domain-containing protein n=1 Tax=Triparma laevis f. inornata TaxID=1714386 RepID=A0A9W6ZHJ6_9STRA|nr:hypothetical protein TL16_g01301 [Triparma laevis f. inornata]
MVKSFDSCMGHVEKDTHQYHYHTAPICLLSKLNIPIPNATSLKYILSSSPLPYWPPTSSTPSPIIGWAMDGFPIKGPYDNDNNLIVRSDLDSCGGAVDPATDGYTYYVTAEPPYFPSCFRAPPGSLVERPYVASDYTTVSSCPKAGYNLTFVNPASTPDLPALSPPVCNEPYDGPFFLFRLDIDLAEPWWSYSSKVFGAIFMFFFCYIAYAMRELTRTGILIVTFSNYKTIQFILLLSLCFCRSFSLFVDPYYTDKSVPPILVGNMYGIVYPIMDSLLALEIISLYTIVQSFTDKQTSRGFSASARKVFLIFSFCEFATQILADTMRSFGYDFKWLMVCQIYFVIWGVLLSTGFTFYGYQLYTKASTLVKAKSGESQNDLQLYLNRIMMKQVWCALVSLVIVLLSVYGLTNQMMTNDEYSSFVLLQRLMEIGLVLLVLLSLLPPHWFASYFNSRSNKKLKSSVLIKHSKRQGKSSNGKSSKSSRSSVEISSAEMSSTSSAPSSEGDDWDKKNPNSVRRQTPLSPSSTKNKYAMKTPKIAPSASSLSRAQMEFNQVISGVRSSAVKKIIDAEELPMVVVPLKDFLEHGRIPRSSDKLTRVKKESDLAVFISHRWWAPKTPDSNTHPLLKYNILKRGLNQLIKQREELEKNKDNIVIWIDFACIEQDNPDELMKGVRSLIAWSLRSAYFLVPVHPDGASAFKTSLSPVDLVNYGNRAWCRVEFYIFLCLSEICGEDLKCFGYGPTDPRSDGNGTAPWVEFRYLCGLRKNVEILRRMADSFSGAKFDSNSMPSNGDLFSEADRSNIKLLETTINVEYTTCVFEVAKMRVNEEKGGRELNLGFKQLSDTNVEGMLEMFFSEEVVIVESLKLEGNMFSGCGLKDEDYKIIGESLGKEGDEKARQPNLYFLDLSENALGDEGSDAFLEAMTCGSCSRMRTLLFRKCNLNDVSGVSICSILRSETCNLAVLSLEDNELGPWSAEELHRCVVEQACTTAIRLDGNKRFPVAIRQEITLYQKVVEHFSRG